MAMLVYQRVYVPVFFGCLSDTPDTPEISKKGMAEDVEVPPVSENARSKEVSPGSELAGGTKRMVAKSCTNGGFFWVFIP